MAGYIGNRAAFLSSTSGADIDGNVTIDGDLTVSGNTVTIDSAQAQEIRLGDNDKMTFGDATGGDLQIYHNGGNSIIADVGTGDLYVAGDNLRLTNAALSEVYARGYANGKFSLYYDNAEKLATTSTGIDVTGTVTADGLTVESGIGNTALLGVSTDSGTEVLLADHVGGVSFKNVNGDIELRVNGAASTAASTRLAQKIDGATGDISFYEDTGTTPKFFWDASAESLGIGKTDRTTTSTFTVQNVNDVTTNTAEFYNDNGNRTFRFAQDTSGNATQLLEKNDGTDAILLNTNGNSYFNGGNVGIGTTSPSSTVHVVYDSGTTNEWTNAGQGLTIQNTSTTKPASLKLSNAAVGQQIVWGGIAGDSYLAFKNYSAERMRIDSSGKVGVGTNSPAALHHVRDGNLNGLNKHAAIIADDSNDGNNGGLLINSYQPRLTLSDSSANAKWYDFKVNGNVLDFGVGANTNQHLRHHNLLQLNEYGHLQAREGFTSDKDNSRSRQAYKMYEVNPYTVNNGGTYVRNYVRLFTMPSSGQSEVQFWLNFQGDHNYNHVFIAYCQIHQWYSSTGNYNYRISSLESNLTGYFRFDSNKGVWWKPSGLWSDTGRLHVITHNNVTIDCDTYSQTPGGTDRSITGLTAISGEHNWGS